MIRRRRRFVWMGFAGGVCVDWEHGAQRRQPSAGGVIVDKLIAPVAEDAAAERIQADAVIGPVRLLGVPQGVLVDVAAAQHLAAVQAQPVLGQRLALCEARGLQNTRTPPVSKSQSSHLNVCYARTHESVCNIDFSHLYFLRVC